MITIMFASSFTKIDQCKLPITGSLVLHHGCQFQRFLAPLMVLLVMKQHINNANGIGA